VRPHARAGKSDEIEEMTVTKRAHARLPLGDRDINAVVARKFLSLHMKRYESEQIFGTAANA
jgi:hypothetical protein